MVNLHAGFTLPEYPFLTYVTEDYIRSLDLCLVKETRGRNYWEQVYRYPSYGLSLFFSTLGNDKILGKEIALNYFFKVNFISRDKFHFYNRTGIGIGYVSRTFDLEKNYLDVAVGSHFNIHFNFRMGTDFFLSDRLEMHLGLSFDHFSNANTREPNLGINYLTGYGGLAYRLGQKTEKQKQEIEAHVRKNNYELFYSIGGKYTRALSSDYFVTSSLSFEMTREFFRVFHLGVGADLFFDPSIESQLIKDGVEFRESYNYQSGIHFSQTFVYNRFSIIIQEGIHLLLTDQLNNKIMYNRGILKCRISNHFSIRLSMKSHLHILDYPELGVGYKF
jgi:hypothetical protein